MNHDREYFISCFQEIMARPTNHEIRYRNTGRPSVLTKDNIRKLEEAFTWGCSDLEACLWAGIGKTAFYDYQKANPEFAERKEKLKATPTITARRTVVNCLGDDKDMAMKYLERKKKDEFSLRQEVTGDDGSDLFGKVTFNIVGNGIQASDNSKQ